MSNVYQTYRWLYEGLWFLAGLIISFALTYKLYGQIRSDFFWFITVVSFGGFTYLRWIIFPEHSPLMFSFWVKLVFLFLNIPLFFFVMRYFAAATEVFDSYNFSFEDRSGQLVSHGIPADLFDYLKTLTIFSATVMLISIVMYQLRAIQLIFKWRQVPQSLTS